MAKIDKTITEIAEEEQPKQPEMSGRVTRRSFLTQLGTASLAVTTVPLFHSAPVQEPGPATEALPGAEVPGAVPMVLNIYHASGVRVRDLPIHIEHLLV